METTYETIVIGSGNHASIEIADENLAEIGANKRAPLKITINGYTYQSTATGVDGKCMVVFPMRDREAAGAAVGDRITITLELDDGYRKVDIPPELRVALTSPIPSEKNSPVRYMKQKPKIQRIEESKKSSSSSGSNNYSIAPSFLPIMRYFIQTNRLELLR